MRVRQGFVSNSSSQSFVILGAPLKKSVKRRQMFEELLSDKQLKKVVKEANGYIPEADQVPWDKMTEEDIEDIEYDLFEAAGLHRTWVDDKEVVGFQLATFDAYDGCSCKFSFEDLATKAEQLTKKMGNHLTGKICIYAGVEGC